MATDEEREREYTKQLSEAATMLAGEVPAGKERDYLIELSRRFTDYKAWVANQQVSGGDR